MWGGRFETKPDAIMEKINASVSFDKKLSHDDITASIAHCRMLAKQNIISRQDARDIEQGLRHIAEEIAKGQFKWKPSLEDVHMNIEARLYELIGEAAGRLHTARSRNDQVATDFRLWVKRAMNNCDKALEQLQKALVFQIQTYGHYVLPGMTHLQNAQAITWGHHFLCYLEMFGRDRLRLQHALARLDECPLGSAALAGTPYPIDRMMTARELGFKEPMANALDAVSDRDFALDFLSCASITAMHLSRMAEELVLWNSAAFAFVQLNDEWTTGSSIMPQKRNPDAAELIRAKASIIFSQLNSLLVILKSLPLAYSKDMQEDKPPVFDAAEHLFLCLDAMTGMVNSLIPQKEKMRDAAQKGFTTATDIADWLVQTHDIPFRQAHHIVGAMVKEAEKQNIFLHQLSNDQLKKISPLLDEKALSQFTIENSIARKTSFGGTAPQNMKQALKAAQKKWSLL